PRPARWWRRSAPEPPPTCQRLPGSTRSSPRCGPRPAARAAWSRGSPRGWAARSARRPPPPPRPPHPRRPLDQLSPREREVLAALARGRANRQIARALAISEETVKAHVSSILAKLQLADRTQAAIFGLQHRLVPLDQALDDEQPRWAQRAALS